MAGKILGRLFSACVKTLTSTRTKSGPETRSLILFEGRGGGGGGPTLFRFPLVYCLVLCAQVKKHS